MSAPRRKRRIAADEAHAWARNLRLRNPYAKLILSMLTLYVNGEGECYASVNALGGGFLNSIGGLLNKATGGTNQVAGSTAGTGGSTDGTGGLSYGPQLPDPSTQTGGATQGLSPEVLAWLQQQQQGGG